MTTEKDYVRLSSGVDEIGALAELKHRSRPFLIAVEFDDAAKVKDLLKAAVVKQRR